MRPEGTIAVTGASGLVGVYVVRALLRRGAQVRAVVRDAGDDSKRAAVLAAAADLGDEAMSRLDFASGDLLVAGSYDEALQGCTGVIHVAAVARILAGPPQQDIVRPAVFGVDNVFAAARRAGSVRRLVLTSSIVAMVRYSEARKGRRFNENDWNTESGLGDDPFGYAKYAAEVRAMDLVGRQPSGAGRLDLVTINAGDVLGTLHDRSHAESSPALIRALLQGEIPAIPRLFFSFVDAEDVGEAHARAMLQPDAAGRHVVSAHELSLAETVDRLRALYPHFRWPRWRVPDFVARMAAGRDERVPPLLLQKLLGTPLRLQNRKSRRSLGLTYTDLDTSLRRTVDALVAHGWATPRLAPEARSTGAR